MIGTIVLTICLAPFAVMGLAAAGKVVVTLLGDGGELQRS